MVGLGSDQGEKWPKPEREHDLQRVRPPEAAEVPEASGPGTYFFCRYAAGNVIIPPTECFLEEIYV